MTNTPRFLRCFTIAVPMLFALNASAQIPTPIPGSPPIKISQYDPKNPEHALITDTAKLLCLNKYAERMKVGGAAAMSAKTKEAGHAILTSSFTEAVNLAGVCVHAINYESRVYEMRNIDGTKFDYSALSDSPSYQTAKKESARTDARRCGQVRYRALAEIMTDETRVAKEMPEFLLNSNLFCMSLLGKQSGIDAVINYFRITLN